MGHGGDRSKEVPTYQAFVNFQNHIPVSLVERYRIMADMRVRRPAMLLIDLLEDELIAWESALEKEDAHIYNSLLLVVARQYDCSTDELKRRVEYVRGRVV